MEAVQEKAEARPAAEPWSILQPVSKVRARVVRVNRKSNAPLDLLSRKVGEEGALGLFVNWRKSEGGFRGTPAQWRVLTVPIVFRDSEGLVHNYIDFKGIGAPREIHKIHPKVKPMPFFATKWYARGRITDTMFGLTHLKAAEKEWRSSGLLKKNGVRTSTPIAVLELKELMDSGRKLTVAEARRKGLIPKGYRPALLVRGHTEALRVKDLYEWDPERHNIPRAVKHDLLEERALKMGFADAEHYLSWFTREIGRNLATMHNAGFAHNNYSFTNLTLDARIVDHETVSGRAIGKPVLPGSFAHDLRTGLDAVYMLGSAASAAVGRTRAGQESAVANEARRFLESYLEARKGLGRAELRRLSTHLKYEMEQDEHERYYRDAAREVFRRRLAK